MVHMVRMVHWAVPVPVQMQHLMALLSELCMLL